MVVGSASSSWVPLVGIKISSPSISFRLALTVQPRAQAEVGDVAKEQWNEVVEDLWENQLPHLREEVYNEGVFVYDPLTGRYGFQEGSEFDSEEELMKDLMNEPEREDYASNGDVEEFFTDDQQPSLELEEEKMRHSEEPRKDGQSKLTPSKFSRLYHKAFVYFVHFRGII